MQPSISIVCWIGILAFGWFSVASGAVSTQVYPNKPIRVVIPSAPSSGPDVVSRLIGAKLTESWRQQVIADNRAGAAGNIGAEIAANASPDGYTLLMANSQHVISAAFFSQLKYDFARDFSPVTLVASTPYVLVVQPSLPVRSIRDLVALAQSKPEFLNYGSGGSGGTIHLATEILANATGIKIVHIPYKSVTLALTDVVAGQLHLTFAAVPAALPLVRTGKLRAIAVTSLKRTPLAPELPTVAESVPGYEVIGWYGLVAPAKTPFHIIAKVSAEVNKGLKSPDLVERISSLGAEPIGTTPEAFGSFITRQLAVMRRAVKTSGMRQD